MAVSGLAGPSLPMQKETLAEAVTCTGFARPSMSYSCSQSIWALLCMSIYSRSAVTAPPMHSLTELAEGWGRRPCRGSVPALAVGAQDSSAIIGQAFWREGKRCYSEAQGQGCTLCMAVPEVSVIGAERPEELVRWL